MAGACGAEATSTSLISSTSKIATGSLAGKVMGAELAVTSLVATSLAAGAATFLGRSPLLHAVKVKTKAVLVNSVICFKFMICSYVAVGG